MSGAKKNEKNESPARQSLLAAKELAAQVETFVEGDDVEEHLRKLDDIAELMMVDETVKYQAILLSMDELTRTEFNAWLKTENLREEVKGNPDALKKRLLEKFQVRKSLLERIDFVLQPRRVGRKLLVDLLERKRIYEDMVAEMMKNREQLLVEMTLRLLSPEDRTDYCNLRPEEAKREMKDLLNFVRRKEEERSRDVNIEQKKKKKKNEELKKKNDDSLTEEEPNPAPKKTAAQRAYEEEEKEERASLMKQGRCFICHELGHIATDCPENPRNWKKKKKTDDDDGPERKQGGFKKEDRRRSDANSI